MSKQFLATATLIGTIIGAGFLGIPYVSMKSGFLISLIEMFLVVIVLLFMMIYLGKLVVKTPGNHQFTGYAEKYLGKNAKVLMFISFAFANYSTILAYLVGEGQSFSHLFFGTTQYELYFGIVFWVFLSSLTYFGLKALEEGEFIGVILVLTLISLIVVFYGNDIKLENLTTFHPENFILPIGVIVFAFIGFSSVPLIKRIIGNDWKAMKRSIITAHIVTFLVYVLFTIVILGYNGLDTPEIATLSLGKIFVLLGALTMFTSYFGASTILRDTFQFDWKFSKNKALMYTILPPLMLFLLVEFFNYNRFTLIINIGAIFAGGFTTILIFYMIFKSRKLLFGK